MNANREIRFVDTQYNEIFRIPDGGIIIITHANGEKSTAKCEYLNETHFGVDGRVFHNQSFAMLHERNGSTIEPEPVKYQLQPYEQSEAKLFFRMDGEEEERHGAIGYMRADFGRDGNGFYTTWFNNQRHLKTHHFKKEFDAVINALRDDGQKPPFASRESLTAFCAANPGMELTTRGLGYMVQTQDYSYYFRCMPRLGEYDIYCLTYDNRYLLPELAGQHELPQMCYSMRPHKGERILIQRGKSGYTPLEDKVMTFDELRQKINHDNGELVVTRAQEEAMLAGSMFGWDAPAAKPWNHNQDGTPRPLPEKKPRVREDDAR